MKASKRHGLTGRQMAMLCKRHGRRRVLEALRSIEACDEPVTFHGVRLECEIDAHAEALAVARVKAQNHARPVQEPESAAPCREKCPVRGCAFREPMNAKTAESMPAVPQRHKHVRARTQGEGRFGYFGEGGKDVKDGED